MSIKYRECYVKDLDKNMPIEELDQYCDNTNHLVEYSNCLYCPECKEAKLAYTGKTNRANSYLSAINVNTHIDCSYKYRTAPSKAYKKKVESFSEEKSRTMLNSAINLIKPRGASNEDRKNLIIETANTLIKNNKKSSSTRYQANRQNLSTAKFDSSVLRLYYGKVKLKKFKKENYSYIHIYIKSRMVGSIYPYRNFDFDIIKEESMYYLAFFGFMKQKDQFLNYHILNNDKKYFYIEKI